MYNDYNPDALQAQETLSIGGRSLTKDTEQEIQNMFLYVYIECISRMQKLIKDRKTRKKNAQKIFGPDCTKEISLGL